MNNTHTKDFDIARQVLATAPIVAKERGLLSGIALQGKSPAITSSKLERKEMVYKPLKLKIANPLTLGYFDNTDKVVSVTSGANMLQEGTIIEFQTTDKKSKGTLRVIVTGITNDTTFTAQKLGGDDVAIIAGDLAYGASIALEEGSTNKEYKGIQVPRDVWNYTQTFRVNGTVTGEAAKLNNWDITDVKAELLRQVTMDVATNLNGLLTSTVRNKVTISGKEIKVSGGLPFFIGNKFDEDGNVIAGTPDNVKDLSGAALTLEHINDGFQHVVENGGVMNAIVCSPNQARKISGFENAKMNIQLVNGEGSTSKKIGGAVQVLESPIKVGNMLIESIYVDTRMAKDELYMFNDKSLEAVPVKDRALVGMKLKEPTGDDDNYRLSGICHFSVYLANAYENSYKLKGLAL